MRPQWGRAAALRGGFSQQVLRGLTGAAGARFNPRRYSVTPLQRQYRAHRLFGVTDYQTL